MKLPLVYSLIGFIIFSSLLNGENPEGAAKYFKDSKFYGVSLSPDGKWVASITTEGKGGERDLLVINVESLKQKHYEVHAGENVYSYDWVTNRDLLFNVSKWNTYAIGMYGVNVEKKGIKRIFDWRILTRVFDPMPYNPDYSWVSMRKSLKGKETIACLNKEYLKRKTLNPLGSLTDNTKYIKKAEDLPIGECFSIVTDNSGDVRVLLHARDGKLRYLHRMTSDDKWSELKLNAEDWKVVDFTANDEKLIIVGYGEENTKGLYEYDLKSETISECLFRDEVYDLDWPTRFKMLNGNLIGLTYNQVAPTSIWFVPQINKLQKLIDKKLPNRANVISDWTRTFDRILISSYSDKAPTCYYYLDVKNQKLNLLSNPRPWIKESDCSPTQVLKFKTKDGLNLESYITLPKTGKAPYPTVCLVHGGPWVRDTGGFDSEVQYLASLGFAVLRVNYRGSLGYGKIISEDNAYAFDKMGDDIMQACRILIKSGYADAQRMAIMGSSFGGFASLQGITKHPDFFRCAVSIAGVFDWEEMIKARKRQGLYYSHQKLLSNLKGADNGSQFVVDLSPINHVDKIKVPVFIAHGKADRNVSAKQSRVLESKLKDRGIPYETFYKEWVGHSRFPEKSRILLYERIGAFLTQYLSETDSATDKIQTASK